jgi:hypothetical protein
MVKYQRPDLRTAPGFAVVRFRIEGNRGASPFLFDFSWFSFSLLLSPESSGENFMVKSSEHQIVPGLTVSSSGQVSVDASLAKVLIDLAIELEEPTDLPVDVEHVVASVVLAVRSGDLRAETQLSADDPVLITLLATHVKTVFEQFGSELDGGD